MPRCFWCTDDPLYIAYHDHEWGVPLRDPQRLFELLLLEGFQAGLSWLTILKKREAFLEAFHHFNISKVAAFPDKKVEELMQQYLFTQTEIFKRFSTDQDFQRRYKEFIFDTLWAQQGIQPPINL